MSEEIDKNKSRDEATENLFHFNDREEARTAKTQNKGTEGDVVYNEELSLQHIFIDKQGDIDASPVVDGAAPETSAYTLTGGVEDEVRQDAQYTGFAAPEQHRADISQTTGVTPEVKPDVAFAEGDTPNRGHRQTIHIDDARVELKDAAYTAEANPGDAAESRQDSDQHQAFAAAPGASAAIVVDEAKGSPIDNSTPNEESNTPTKENNPPVEAPNPPIEEPNPPIEENTAPVAPNTAPVAGPGITSRVDEDDTRVSGQLTAFDPDEGATARYSITQGSTEPDGFSLQGDGSYSFDPAHSAYEHLNVGDTLVLEVPVTVTDDHGATDTNNIQLIVTGTNDTPTAISATGGSIPENVAAGTVVAQLFATDVDDSSDNLRYSIAGDSGQFEIAGDQVVVKNGAQINYEAESEYTLGIRVTDENGASYQQDFQFQVADINETPTSIEISATDVDENAAGGTVVAQLVASDPDSEESFTYELSDASGLFEIAGDQVVVKEGAAIDYESAQAHEISVTVTDSAGNTYSEPFTIQVSDIWESINPVAADDTLESAFTPGSATLAAELNFDEGVPSATVGSISAEVDGQVGNAADFSSAKLTVGGIDLSDATGDQTTISMWIQGNPGGSWEMLAAADTYDLALLDGNIGFNTGNSDLFGTDASELADGEWHHIVGTFTNGDVSQNTIFIDGVEQEMTQIQSSPSNARANIDSDSGTLHFGSWGANNSYLFTGSMDEIKVFNGDLSAEEVSELYAIEAGHDHWDNSGQGDTLEDTALVISPADLLANDTDVDSEVLTIASVGDAEHGSVELNEDGDIVFTPEEDYHGEASFAYTVTDGEGGSASATVNLTVASVNDLPVIDVVNSVSVDEDGQVNILYDISDIDSDSVSLEGSSSDGTVTINDNSTLTFSPVENFSGDTSITLTATDADGGITTQEIGVTVNEIADAPEAANDTLESAFTPENATLAAELNFDEGVPSATVGSISAEVDGQVGNAADFSSAKLTVGGIDLSDATGDQTTISMWIQGNPGGSWEMLAAADTYDLALLNGNIGFNTGNGDLFGTDAGELADGEWHHIVGTFTNGDVSQNTIFIDGVEQEMTQIQSSPSNARANIDSDSGTLHFGSWGANNSYLFTGSMDEIKVFNGDLTAEEVSELYAIEAGHDHWDNSGQGDTLEDTALVINPADLLANDTDVDSEVLTIASVGDAEHGSVELNEDGDIVFTPEEDYHGEASFAYTVTDGEGGSASATVNLTVASVNDLPVIDVVNSVSVDEDGQVNILYDISDIDSDSVSLEGSSSDGTVTINDNSTLTFSPVENFSGDTSITLTATDADGGITTQEIGVTVNEIADAPEAANDTLESAFTPENATLAAELNFDEGVPSATVGSISAEVDGQVGNAADFSSAKLTVGGIDLSDATGDQTTISMWIQGNPGGSWEMLAAADTYDLALLNGNIGFNTGNGDLFGTDASELADGEWHHIVGTFTNGDVSQNTIFIDGVEQEMTQIQSSPSNARANIDSDSGTLHFGSWGHSNGYLFTGSMDEVKVFNGGLSVEEVSELYAIEASHDHWDNSGQGDTLEDTALVINPADLLANDTDVDSEVLTIASVGDAEHGSVELNEDGDIVFTPEEDYHGEASFAYTVTDGEGGSASATVNLTVASVNDLPVIDVVNSVSVDEDGQVNILYDISDIDSDSVSLEGSSSDGTVTINDNSTLTFSPVENFSGDTSITLTATDTDGGIATQEIGVTVSDVNIGGNSVFGTEGGETITGTSGADTLHGLGGDDQLYGAEGDDILSGGSGDDAAYGGEGNDVFEMHTSEGNDYFDGGAGGAWTDTIHISANPEDGDSPWSIIVNGEEVEYDLAAGALELEPDTSGVISMADGKELVFEGIELIQW